MITNIEIAKSNRSTCVGCDNKISQGEWRGTENVWSFAIRNTIKKFYCRECVTKKLIIHQSKIEKW